MDLSKLTDSEIIHQYLRNHQSEYFGVLYKRYAGKVFSKCLSLLKDEGLAQDAMQDIFVKVYTNLSKFGERSKFSTWLYSITYNFCIDMIRRKKKEKFLFSEEIEGAPDIIDDIEDAEILEIEVSRLKVVLDNMPAGDKAVLLMKYQDDLSIKDIAQVLNKSDSAVKMKLKRAKHRAQLVYKDIFPQEA